MTPTSKTKKAALPMTPPARGPFAAYADWRARRAAAAIERRRSGLTVESLLRGVDPAGLAGLKQRCADAGDGRPDVFWTKYLDADAWLDKNIRIVKDLGLVENPPRDVLDLGCGGGFFLATCRALGSRVLGLDLDTDVVLNEMVALLRLRRVAWMIRPFVPLPDLGRRFDLVTAFMICFNLPMNRPAWTAAEWDFLLDDLTARLRPRGRLVLSLNRQLDDDQLYSDDLRAFFESRGADIQGKRLTFTREDLARTKSDRFALPATA